MRAPGNEGVAGRIQQSEGSIGYIEYGFAQELNLKTAILENKEGKFVKASGLSIIAGLAGAQLPDNLRAFVPDPSGSDSYPIVTYSWILLRKNNPDAAKAKLIHDLFSWCLQDGQRIRSHRWVRAATRYCGGEGIGRAREYYIGKINLK